VTVVTDGTLPDAVIPGSSDGPPQEIVPPGGGASFPPVSDGGPRIPGAGAGLTATVPPALHRRAAFKRGIPVTLTSGRALTVKLRLLYRGHGLSKSSRQVAAAAKIGLTPGVQRVLRLRLSRSAKDALRSQRHARLTLELRVVGGARSSAPVRQSISVVP
jgi:hypothetical protein